MGRRVEKRVITPELVEHFNDICMREFKYDINEEGHLYDMFNYEIFIYKDKFLKYCDSEDKIVRSNEIELNLLENSRLLNVLFGMMLTRYGELHRVDIMGFYQSNSNYGERGYVAYSFVDTDGIIKEIRSDEFLNESVRLLNLLCKINHTEKMYDFELFDILTEYN